MRSPGWWKASRAETPLRPLVKGRGAFTLVEVVVACVVFVAGVLALQSAFTVVLRQSRDARAQTLSAEVAAARFESFIHAPCTEAAAGAELFRGVRSEWSSAGPAGAAARLSTQTIGFVRGRLQRTDSYQGAYRCR